MEKPRLQVDEAKEVFTLQEAAVLFDVTYKDVRKLVLTGELEAKKYGTKYLISKDDIKRFVFQQELERENQEEERAKMPSIVQRSNRYNVVYLYDDEATGKRKQKWESFSTLEDAKRRKAEAEAEYRQELGNVVIQ